MLPMNDGTNTAKKKKIKLKDLFVFQSDYKANKYKLNYYMNEQPMASVVQGTIINYQTTLTGF